VVAGRIIYAWIMLLPVGGRMLFAVVSIFGLALFAPFVHRVARGATGWLLAVLPAAIALVFGL